MGCLAFQGGCGRDCKSGCLTTFCTRRPLEATRIFNRAAQLKHDLEGLRKNRGRTSQSRRRTWNDTREQMVVKSEVPGGGGSAAHDQPADGEEEGAAAAPLTRKGERINYLGASRLVCETEWAEYLSEALPYLHNR